MYIFTRTQDCAEQCLINIPSNFAGVSFSESNNLCLLGPRLGIRLRRCAFALPCHATPPRHVFVMCFMCSFTYPPIDSQYAAWLSPLQSRPWKTFEAQKVNISALRATIFLSQLLNFAVGAQKQLRPCINEQVWPGSSII